MGTVRALRGIAVDLRSVASAIGATAARARATFKPQSGDYGASPTCEAPGCGAPATHPCICEAVYCARHYAEAVSPLDPNVEHWAWEHDLGDEG